MKNAGKNKLLENQEEVKKAPKFFESMAKQEEEAPPPPPKFYQVEYYREYFNISTGQAVDRLLKALWPFRPQSFIETEIKPDLYVPIWTLFTLIITMSTFGNIVSALKEAHESENSTLNLEFDPTKFTFCASLLCFYMIINPVLFYLILHCKGAPITIVKLLCLYGYSYVPFIPMSLIFVTQNPISQVVSLCNLY